MDQQLGVINAAPTENNRRGDIYDALRIQQHSLALVHVRPL